MKSLVYILLIVSVITLILSVIGKYAIGAAAARGLVAGIGPTGYLNATMVILLFAANLALLELLKKK